MSNKPIYDAEYPHCVTQEQIIRYNKWIKATSSYFQTTKEYLLAKGDIINVNDRKAVVILVEEETDGLYTNYFVF